MTDPTTNRRIHVWPAPEVGPWVIVPVSKLSQVQALLDKNLVRYSLSELVLSVDGNPPTRKINLARGTDPEVVQRLLDDLP
jgi:hypothetical protein